MANKRRTIGNLIEKLSYLETGRINYDSAVIGMKEFPRILLEKSRLNILNKNYSQAKKDLINYKNVSKMLEESVGYKNNLLENNYKIQKKVMDEIFSKGYFDKNNNEPNRAYE